MKAADEITGEMVIIKERPPLRYTLAVGLFTILPTLLLGSILLNPAIFWVGLLICTSFLLLLSRSFSIEISVDGICQRIFGIPIYFIKWQEIKSISYIDSFSCPFYRIRSLRSWLRSIDLPIDDDSFPIIKQALAQQGLVLAQAQLTKDRSH